VTPVGRKVDLHPDGRLTVVDSGYLAGSTATLKDAIAYVPANTGFSLGDAVHMATTNPGRFAGVPGVLRIGAPADLVRFRWEPGFSSIAIEDVIVQAGVTEIASEKTTYRY
jgi:N-acetylglucosamine-6-phosphate deacetylase